MRLKITALLIISYLLISLLVFAVDTDHRSDPSAKHYTREDTEKLVVEGGKLAHFGNIQISQIWTAKSNRADGLMEIYVNLTGFDLEDKNQRVPYQIKNYRIGYCSDCVNEAYGIEGKRKRGFKTVTERDVERFWRALRKKIEDKEFNAILITEGKESMELENDLEDLKNRKKEIEGQLGKLSFSDEVKRAQLARELEDVNQAIAELESKKNDSEKNVRTKIKRQILEGIKIKKND